MMILDFTNRKRGVLSSIDWLSSRSCLSYCPVESRVGPTFVAFTLDTVARDFILVFDATLSNGGKSFDIRLHTNRNASN